MGRKPSEGKALKLFGETEDPTKAGWILPSGKLVYWADCHDFMAIKISDCLKEDIIQQGWVRVLHHSEFSKEDGVEISADEEPTIQQLRRIYELVEQTGGEYFHVEWTDKDGKHLEKVLPSDPDEVMYCMGAMHQVGFEQVYQEYKIRKEKGEIK